MLDKEYEYYLAHKDELVAKHNDKFVAIKDGQVVGVYASRPEAIEKTAKVHPLGTFLIQHITKEEEVQRFYSRVSF